MSGWFKLWPGRLVSPAFLALTPAARSSYLFAFVLAHQAREKGLAMVVADLASFTGLPLQRQRLVLSEVANRGLLELDGDVIRLPLFEDMQRPPTTSTERVRRWRENQLALAVSGVARNGNVTPRETLGNALRERQEDREDHTPTSSELPDGNSTDSGEPSALGWAGVLEQACTPLLSRDLASLMPWERFVIARRHAFLFANCRRSEGANAAKARQLAAGIASLTERLNRDRVDVSVHEYLRAAEALWQRGGEAPLYRVGDVYAELVEVRA